MRVILFGGSGMVGQGVLRECLLDPEVESVLAIGRSSTGFNHAKLYEQLRKNLFDLSDIELDLQGYDACFYCLGVSSFGMTEEQYRRITFELTLTIGKTLARLNPLMTFIYVSGAGTDSSESGSSMWARVKGKTENALLQLPFQGYMFRPAMIVPLHGIKSRTRMYRWFYAATTPVLPWLFARFPRYVTTTEQMGRAMIKVARNNTTKRVLESIDINLL